MDVTRGDGTGGQDRPRGGEGELNGALAEGDDTREGRRRS